MRASADRERAVQVVRPVAEEPITHGAITMKSAVRPPSPSSISQKIDEATRQARFRSPLTSRSLKTGTNAAESAESATSDRTVFGIRKAISKALIGPLIPNRCGLPDLPHEPEDPRERRWRPRR